MKSIIWDVDGTLLESEAGIIACYKYAVKTLGLKSDNEVDYTSFIGIMPQEAFKYSFNLSDEQAQEATDVFRVHYKEKQIFNASLYDGVVAVLEEFHKRGYKQAVATNKRGDFAKEICEHFGIAKYFTAIWGADFKGTLTKADLIALCLKDLEVTDKSTALMIGDTHVDKDGAAKCEVPFLPVHYGIGDLESECKVEKPIDILRYVS